MFHAAIDMEGKKIGYWTVFERTEAPSYVNEKVKKNAWWRCVCRCGIERPIQGSALRSGKTKSCGCFGHKKNSRHANIKTKYPRHHACKNDPMYQYWNHMLLKCYQQKSIHYKNYGGIGITVCDEWRRAPIFVQWAKTSGFKPNHSLELLENETVFSPSTVRWVEKGNKISKLKRKNNNTQDLTGQLFKWLYVLNQEDFFTPKGTRRNGFRCRCVCGNTCLAIPLDLLIGKKVSCGCRGRISEWSLNYRVCILCGKNDSRYAAHGKCFRCYQKERK